MKKFNISSQLLILFFIIILATSMVFMVSCYFSIHMSAEDQIYARLESYCSNERNYNQSVEQGPDMTVFRISKRLNEDEPEFQESNAIITEEEFYEILSEIEENKENQPNLSYNYIAKSKVRVASGTLYYYARVNDNGQSYTFCFTDDTFVRSFVNSLFFRLFTAFVGIIFLAVAVIYAWSTHVTHRLKMIQNHIISLPKNKYEEAYQDDSLDEIGELSRSVEAMRLEIGTNEKTKQDMLQNLSHDFKTPIAVIKSYAEAYQDGMAGAEALDVIITQAELLKKKVNRLLQYNSLEYLTKDKPFEEVHMTELVNQVVSNYKFQTDLKFTLDLSDDVIFMGYLENWTTVVENIIDNAKRYAKTEIKIVLRDARLRIYNDGEPIDEQFLNSVFRPYEKGSKGQFGLGMSIVKKTVDFFGMNMHVQNEEYGGVSFIIEKPENNA